MTTKTKTRRKAGSKKTARTITVELTPWELDQVCDDLLCDIRGNIPASDTPTPALLENSCR